MWPAWIGGGLWGIIAALLGWPLEVRRPMAASLYQAVIGCGIGGLTLPRGRLFHQGIIGKEGQLWALGIGSRGWRGGDCECTGWVPGSGRYHHPPHSCQVGPLFDRLYE